MSTSEIAVFDSAIKESQHCLEFGVGGSTLRAILKSNAMIYSVESNPEWLTRLRQYSIVRKLENKRLNLFLVNIGPTRNWGYPIAEDSNELFEVYSSSIFDSIDKDRIDLALIDGRFRVACTLKLILECYQNQTLHILIHDFWSRAEYHILLKYLDTIERVETIGLFSIKNDIDIESVKIDYDAYKLNSY